MANILAAATGNWSSTATWTGGVLPGAADIAVANGKTVTIDQDISVTSLSNTTTGGAVAGGNFVVSSITGTRNILASAGLGGALIGIINIGLISITATSGIVNFGSTTITGGNTGNFVCVLISGAGGCTITTTGNITGGAGNSASHGISSTTAFTLNAVNIFGGFHQGVSGVYSSGNNTIINAVNATGNQTSASLTLVTGVTTVGTSTITLTGNAIGGGVNTTTNTSSGIYATGVSTVIVQGNSTAGNGTNCPGVNASNASSVVDIWGTTTASSSSNGLMSGSITNRVRTLVDASNGRKAVYAPAWVTPLQAQVSHRIYSETVSVNPYQTSTPTAQITLTNYISNTPPVTDVRAGKTYGLNNDLVGTLIVPTVDKVSAGTAVDNTVGIAAIIPSDIWNYEVATGVQAKDRLLNNATIDSTGAQIAAAIGA